MTVVISGFDDLRLSDNRYLDWSIVGRDGQDLTALTATVTIYDSGGTALVTSAAATISGTTERTIASYLMETGSGHAITAVGAYRVVLTVTCLGEVVSYQSALAVVALPA